MVSSLAPEGGPLLLLIPGAGTDPGYWDALRSQLEARGCASTAVDLPCADENARLQAYARAAVGNIPAAQRAAGVHVVAHSFGAFTAGLLPDLIPVERIWLLSPMIPAPGESGAGWWAATGQEAAHEEAARAAGRDLPLDMNELFYHDFSAPERAQADAWERDQADTAFSQPWPASAWPDVPTAVLAFREDRLFPPEFLRGVARERLGTHTFGEVPGGHMGMVNHPRELAEALSG